MKKVTELTEELAAPLAAAAGCRIWDVEYVREAGTWYLRVYIDCDGGVSIDQCEAVHRPLSDALDEADPIEGSYTLEVCSAGCFRTLKKPEHFAGCMGQEVEVRLYRPRNGSKEYRGVLTGYDAGDVTITAPDGEAQLFPRQDLALVRLYTEL